MSVNLDQYPLAKQAYEQQKQAAAAEKDMPFTHFTALLDRAVNVVANYTDGTPGEKEAVMVGAIILAGDGRGDEKTFVKNYSPKIQRFVDSLTTINMEENANPAKYIAAGQAECAFTIASIQQMTDSLKKGQMPNYRPNYCADLEDTREALDLYGVSMRTYRDFMQGSAPKLNKLYKEAVKECTDAIDNFKPAAKPAAAAKKHHHGMKM